MDFWKKYYYEYLAAFTAFLVPPGAKTLAIDANEAAAHKFAALPDDRFDYITASDVLGHVADVQAFLDAARAILREDGRIVITQYNALWEPVLRVASRIGLRSGPVEQNWLSRHDLHTFAYLAGLDVVKSGTKMLMPVYIPGVSFVLNAILSNIWPFTRLGLFHYVVLRTTERRHAGAEPSISIVVPARNEAGTVEQIVRELPELGAFTEIVFVEGNSTDTTYAEIERVAREFGGPGKRRIAYARQDGRGKGDAVRKGFAMASGDILAIYDADMTVPPEEMRKFYEAIAGNRADFVNGSRLVYPLERDSMRVLNFLGNKFFSMAFSWILGEPLKDTLCGTKVLWREDYAKIEKGRAFFGDFDPFGDFDLLFGAAKLNLKIVDLPIHYKQRVYGETNISRWKHGMLLLRMTVFAAKKLRFI